MTKKSIILLVLLASCFPEDIVHRDYPVVVTNPVTAINKSGATLSAEIIYTTNDPILEHGFIWGDTQELVLTSDDSYFSKLGILTKNEFAQTIHSTLVEGKTYKVRAYLQTSTKTIYGPIISFISKGSEGPKLFAVNPTIANVGDTVLISGSAFSRNKSDNEVIIDSQKAIVIDANEHNLSVIIPFITSRRPNIFIRIKDSKSDTRNDLLEVNVPSFIVTPFPPSLCDAIIITGSNFPKNIIPKIYFNQVAAEVIILGPQLFQTKAPEGATGVTRINLLWTEETYSSSDTFQFRTPEITQIFPYSLTIGDVLTIKGENFIQPISIKINDISVPFTSTNENTIQVPINQSFTLNPILTIKICESQFVYIDKLQIN